VYISDPKWFPRKTLLVAGDARFLGSNSLAILSSDEQLLLSGYGTPLPENETFVNPYTRVNEGIFTNGLLQTKVAAMQHFDNLLYMLFDNAQVIRAFDSSGALLNEWALPVAVVGSVSSVNASHLEAHLLYHYF